MRKIREVLNYKFSHHLSHERISGALGIGKGSVHNILERFERSKFCWPLPEEITDSELEKTLYPIEKSEVPIPDLAYLEKEICRPHVTLQLLYEEYRDTHPKGLGRSAFYEHFSRYRSKKPDMKVIHKGGDKLFVDFSGDGLEYVEKATGEVISVELFVCSWGASSFSYVEAVETQRIEDFVPCHVSGFEYFKAVPHGLVPDNLKSGVKKANRYDPIMNPLYQKMAEHYMTAILPARVGKPKDKAVVESNVLHVQRFILGRLRNRTFFSLVEINEAVFDLLEEFNNRPMKDYGGQSRRERFFELDLPYAKPLPSQRFLITEIKLGVRVGPNYHIRFKDHYYSIPWELARRRVDVYQVGGIIEIYHDHRHACRHRLGTRQYGYTTTSAHMPAEHRFVKGWSKAWFISEAGKIGPASAEAVKITMEKQEHVQQGFNAALGILRFAKVFTPQRLEKACTRVLHFKSVSYRAIKAVLDQKLDQEPLELRKKTIQGNFFHDNIRGAHYYENQNKEQKNA